MMGEQIRLKPDKSSQLDRSAVRQRQLVDDRKTDGFAQRGVTSSSQLQSSLHHYKLEQQSILSQSMTSYLWCWPLDQLPIATIDFTPMLLSALDVEAVSTSDFGVSGSELSSHRGWQSSRSVIGVFARLSCRRPQAPMSSCTRRLGDGEARR